MDEHLKNGMAKLRSFNWRSGPTPWGIDSARIIGVARFISVVVRYRKLSLVILVAASLFPVGLHAANTQSQEENRAKCSDSDPDIGIAGCTADILSGSETVPSDLATAYINRATAYGLKGRDDEACSDAEKATHIAPSLAAVYDHRGVFCFYRKGNMDKAIADFSKAISLNPDFFPAFRNRCNAYYDKRMLDQALADCNKAVSLKPDDAFSYLSRGKVYGLQDFYEKAIADMDRAIALDPHLQESYFDRGMAYRLAGSPEKAVADFDKAVSLDPRDARALYARASSLEALGRRDEAVADYRATLKLVPGRPKALESLRRLGASPER